MLPSPVHLMPPSAHLLLKATVTSWVPKTRVLSVRPSFVTSGKGVWYLGCYSAVSPYLGKPRVSSEPVLKGWEAF